MKKILISMGMLFALLSFSLAAEVPETPMTLAGVKVVDSAYVKANLTKVKIFDVRKKSEYAEGHIPGVIFVPYEEKSEKKADADLSADSIDLTKFPADKKAPLIVYCNGLKCWKSYKTAITLKKNGYTNVLWDRGGYPAWKEASLKDKSYKIEL